MLAWFAVLFFISLFLKQKRKLYFLFLSPFRIRRDLRRGFIYLILFFDEKRDVVFFITVLCYLEIYDEDIIFKMRIR